MIIEPESNSKNDNDSSLLVKLMDSLPGCFDQNQMDITENVDDTREDVSNVPNDHHPTDDDSSLLRNELESLREELLKEIQSKEKLIDSWQEKYNQTSKRLKVVEKTLELEREEKQRAAKDLRGSRESFDADVDPEISLVEEVKMIRTYISKLRSSSQKEEQLREEMKTRYEETLEKLEEKKNILQQKLEEEILAKKEAEKETDKAVALCEEAIRTAKEERDENENKIKEVEGMRDAALKEKDEALAVCHDAVEKKTAAETHLENMKQFITDAKVIDKTNERLHILLKEQMKERVDLYNKIEDLKGRIRVNIRIRPLSQMEISNSYSPVLIKADNRTCQLHDPLLFRGQTKSWEFDKIYSGHKKEGNDQEDIFEDTKRLVQSAIDGFNVSVFAYGQTGGGKTYTMGFESEQTPIDDDSSSNFVLHEDTGMAPRVAIEIFRLLESRKSAFETTVTVNMFELYNHYLRDLLNDSAVDSKEKYNSNLQIKLSEHSKTGLVEVDGAMSVVVNNPAELMKLIKVGTQRRATASTVFNADSSRSHLIFSILIKQVNKRTKDVIMGKFSFVDLAGSERVGRSRVAGTQLKEAQSINKSLSALGDVIHALTTAVKHVPFRNHPLTMLMSDSLGGNAKTMMFVCCSPADFNKGETVSALDFAQRCKLVKNNAKTSSATEQAAQNRLQADLQHIKTNAPDMSNLSTLNDIRKQSVKEVSDH